MRIFHMSYHLHQHPNTHTSYDGRANKFLLFKSEDNVYVLVVALLFENEKTLYLTHVVLLYPLFLTVLQLELGQLS